jgi:SprT protein
MSNQKLRFVLARYLPPKALDYCVRIWEEKRFDLTVTPKRSTKLGDYSYDSKTKRHKVTVNGDLNPYSFLVTYIHEVAHFRTYINHGFAVKPHGKEWKQEFSVLMRPMLMASVFPEHMSPALKKYFSNPKASSCSDIELLKALKTEDDRQEREIFLSDVENGQEFIFNKRIFIKELTKRTRALCLEPKTGKKFLISEAATVELVG